MKEDKKKMPIKSSKRFQKYLRRGIERKKGKRENTENHFNERRGR